MTFHSDDHLLLFLRRTLPLNQSITYRGDHDPQKLATVCRVYGIPEPSQVLVLYDDTLFGSGEEGFIVTALGFGFKNIMEEPRWCPFDQFELEHITIEPDAKGSRLRVLGDVPGITEVGTDFVDRLAEALRELARVSAQRGGSAYRTKVAALPGVAHGRPIDLTALLALVHRHTFRGEAHFVSPGIPPRKLKTVTKLHGITPPEHVVFVYDDTLWGSAEDGVVLTTERVAYKEFTERPVSVPFESLMIDDVTAHSDGLMVRGQVLRFHALQKDLFVRLLRDIIERTSDLRG